MRLGGRTWSRRRRQPDGSGFPGGKVIRNVSRRPRPMSIVRVTLVLVAFGCAPADVVDGWPLGRAIPCSMTGSLADARAAVDTDLRRLAGDQAAVSEDCWFPGPYSVDGHPIYWESTPGGIEVHVFRLQNGSRHAVSVSCPGLTELPPGQPDVPGPRCQVVALPTSAPPL